MWGVMSLPPPHDLQLNYTYYTVTHEFYLIYDRGLHLG
jgi:hypothetical protein